MRDEYAVESKTLRERTFDIAEHQSPDHLLLIAEFLLERELRDDALGIRS